MDIFSTQSENGRLVDEIARLKVNIQKSGQTVTEQDTQIISLQSALD